MIGKNIDQITEQDLQDLVDNSVLESKTIEYKQSLPGDSPSEKREFLADVSAFANTSGGDLIYGISEDKDTRAPKSLDGLSIQKVDPEISRLENIIRDGIEPRISSRIHHFGLSNSNTALIIRIPRSWNIAHRVIFRGHDKFYGRNSNGKYPLDVGELRTLFNLSATLAEQIKRFRENRISSMIANESFVPLTDNPKMVVHLIPMISLSPGQKYDFGLISNLTQRRPMGWAGGIVDIILMGSGSGFSRGNSVISDFSKGNAIFPLSYQLKTKILEIYVLSSVRSVTFIAQDKQLSHQAP